MGKIELWACFGRSVPGKADSSSRAADFDVRVSGVGSCLCSSRVRVRVVSAAFVGRLTKHFLCQSN